jgi:hypothetical protein
MSEHEPAPLVEQIAEMLAEHALSSADRNLGRYRTEWTCDCGDTWVTDGHKAESCKSGYDAHLASQLALLVEHEKHEAWREGRDATWSHIGLRRGLAPDNPYARD